MEYCIAALALINTHQSVFFCCIAHVAAGFKTVIPFWSEKDVQNKLRKYQFQRYLQMFDKLFEEQYTPSL